MPYCQCMYVSRLLLFLWLECFVMWPSVDWPPPSSYPRNHWMSPYSIESCLIFTKTSCTMEQMEILKRDQPPKICKSLLSSKKLLGSIGLIIVFLLIIIICLIGKIANLKEETPTSSYNINGEIWTTYLEPNTGGPRIHSMSFFG